eukprot:CAMPEP_0183734242 /NCGR_PEP_ID=MMETSP0737-20130205/43289_1 /TAXON_ID=385413 /ORGANISM="Thalassiosira miniscula, Strain CCMP1093" /LENGTH=285 /DNA_ID=CAMNT_0025967693 /DNA_START=248 /DNA_END=1105 /DNA_ORIENTATION=+
MASNASEADGESTDHSSSASKAAKLYADIAVDYNAAKSNPFKRYVEEPTFASVLSRGPRLSCQHVLDLGCGAGHYCRMLKNEMNAEIVRGVDVSEHMLNEAKRQEIQMPLGIEYMCQDLLAPSAAANITKTFGPPDQADLVMAEYLIPYAANEKELNQFCATASALVKQGGRFVSIVSLCSDSIMSNHMGLLESKTLGWVATWEGEPHDGMCVDFSLFAEDGSSRCTFPNYVYSKETIECALRTSGFEEIEWVPMVAGHDSPDAIKSALDDIAKTPVGVFVARRL